MKSPFESERERFRRQAGLPGALDYEGIDPHEGLLDGSRDQEVFGLDWSQDLLRPPSVRIGVEPPWARRGLELSRTRPDKSDSHFRGYLQEVFGPSSSETRVERLEEYAWYVGKIEDRPRAIKLLHEGATDAKEKLVPSEKAKALPAFAAQLAQLGEVEEAEALFEQALKSALTLEEREKRLQELLHYAARAAQLKEKELGRKLLIQGAELVAGHSQDPLQRVESVTPFAIGLDHVGDTDKVEELFRRILRVAFSIEQPGHRLHALERCAACAARLEHTDLARTLLMRAADEVQRRLAPSQQAVALALIAAELAKTRDVEEVGTLLDRALDAVFAVEPLDQRLQNVERYVRQVGQIQNGELARETLARGAKRSMQRVSDPVEQLRVLRFFGEQLYAQGGLGAAETVWRWMLELALAIQDPSVQYEELARRVDFLRQLADKGLVLRVFARDCERIQSAIDRREKPKVLMLYALQRDHLDDTEGAHALFREILELALLEDATQRVNAVDWYVTCTDQLKDRETAKTLLEWGAKQVVERIAQHSEQVEILPLFAERLGEMDRPEVLEVLLDWLLNLILAPEQSEKQFREIERQVTWISHLQNRQLAADLLEGIVKAIQGTRNLSQQLEVFSHLARQLALENDSQGSGFFFGEALELASQIEPQEQRVKEIERQIAWLGMSVARDLASAIAVTGAAHIEQTVELPRLLGILPRLVLGLARLSARPQAGLLLSQSLELASRTEPSERRQQEIERQISVVCELEDEKLAIDLLMQGAEGAKERLEIPRQLEVLPRLAVKVALLGNVEQAGSLLNQSLELASRTEPSERRQQEIERQISVVCELEDEKLAIDLLMQGAEGAKERLEIPRQLEVLPRLAVRVALLGNVEQAGSLLNQSLELASRTEPLERRQQEIERQISVVCELEDEKLAIDLLMQGAEGAKERLELPRQLEVLPRLAVKVALLGNVEQAAWFLGWALEVAPQIEPKEKRLEEIDRQTSGVARVDDSRLAATPMVQTVAYVQHTLGTTRQLAVLTALALQLAYLGSMEPAESVLCQINELIVHSDGLEQNRVALRQMVDSILRDSDPKLALKIAPSLAQHFAQVGELEQARAVLDTALDMSSLSPLERVRLLATSSNALLDDDLQTAVELIDKAWQIATKSAPARGKWESIIVVSERLPAAEGFAVARIEGYRQGFALLPHKEYRLLVSIQTEAPGGFTGKSSQFGSSPTAVEIDVLVRANGAQIRPHWLQAIAFSRDCPSAPLEFKLTFGDSSCKEICIEFYFQRHWLTDLRLGVVVA